MREEHRFVRTNASESNLILFMDYHHGDTFHAQKQSVSLFVINRIKDEFSAFISSLECSPRLLLQNGNFRQLVNKVLYNKQIDGALQKVKILDMPFSFNSWPPVSINSKWWTKL